MDVACGQEEHEARSSREKRKEPSFVKGASRVESLVGTRRTEEHQSGRVAVPNPSCTQQTSKRRETPSNNLHFPWKSQSRCCCCDVKGRLSCLCHDCLYCELSAVAVEKGVCEMYPRTPSHSSSSRRRRSSSSSSSRKQQEDTQPLNFLFLRLAEPILDLEGRRWCWCPLPACMLPGYTNRTTWAKTNTTAAKSGNMEPCARKRASR